MRELSMGKQTDIFRKGREMANMRQFVETWETGSLKTISYYLRGELYQKFWYDKDGHCIKHFELGEGENDETKN